MDKSYHKFMRRITESSRDTVESIAKINGANVQWHTDSSGAITADHELVGHIVSELEDAGVECFISNDTYITFEI